MSQYEDVFLLAFCNNDERLADDLQSLGPLHETLSDLIESRETWGGVNLYEYVARRKAGRP